MADGNILVIVNLIVTVIGLLSVGFTLGSRIGKLEQKIDGHRELMQTRINQMEKDRQDCEQREKLTQQDHETRLRKVEKGGPHA